MIKYGFGRVFVTALPIVECPPAVRSQPPYLLTYLIPNMFLTLSFQYTG